MAELFVLRSDEIRGWDTQVRTLSEDLRTHELSLTKMDEAYAGEADIKKAIAAKRAGADRLRAPVRCQIPLASCAGAIQLT